MGKHYQPIKTPFSLRVREFRHRVLPVVVFIGVGLIVASLWRGNIAEPGFFGMVVADSANVSSPVAGVVEIINTSEFEHVNEGDPVAVIQVTDSAYIQSRLNVIRAQIDFIRSGMDPLMNRQRNRLDLEGLKMEMSILEAELAALVVEKGFAERQLQSADALFQADMISELEYTDRRSVHQALEEEIRVKQSILDRMTGSISQLSDTLASGRDEHIIDASIRIQNSMLQEILEEMKPVIIRAPLAGVVSQLYRRNGEAVQPGDPILKIESTEPKYITGFVRQPLSVRPQTGMEVQVRTRNAARDFFTSEIIAVGGHFVPLEPALQRPGIMYESGLPVKIALTGDIEHSLVPGEVVDIVLRSQNSSVGSEP